MEMDVLGRRGTVGPGFGILGECRQEALGLEALVHKLEAYRQEAPGLGVLAHKLEAPGLEALAHKLEACRQEAPVLGALAHKLVLAVEGALVLV